MPANTHGPLVRQRFDVGLYVGLFGVRGVFGRNTNMRNALGGKLAEASARITCVVLEAARSVDLANPGRTALCIFEAVKGVVGITAGKREHAGGEGSKQGAGHEPGVRV